MPSKNSKKIEPSKTKSYKSTNKQNQKTRVKKGGELLSSGSYGCVYSPPLPCDKEPTKKPGPNDISKLFIRPDEAQSEWLHAVLLKTIDPKQNYFLYPRVQCSTSIDAVRANDREGTKCPLIEEPVEPNTRYAQLISMNGGKSMYDFMADRYIAGNPLTFREYIELLIPIAKGIQVLNSKGYCHHDIKPNNILIDDTNTPRIIDFGFMTESKTIPTSSNRFLKKNYWIHPPEYWVMDKKLSGESLTNSTKLKYILDRVGEYSSVFSEKDLKEILEWYLLYWPSLSDIEKTYLIALDTDPTPILSSPNYPQYVDVYSLGIMMMYMIEFLADIKLPDFYSSELFTTYKSIVRGATHPVVQKRYSISKVLKLLRNLIK